MIIGLCLIGWILFCGSDGMLNFVLYSFFNVFNYCLLIIGFLSIVVKDSLCNV